MVDVGNKSQYELVELVELSSSPKISSNQRKTEHKQIIGLDLLRAGAALLVLLFHLSFWDWRGQATHPQVPRAFAFYTPLSSQGWIGVEIFFVISGFVIAYSTKTVTSIQFLQHRLTRLLPGALVCATLSGLLLLTAYPPKMVADHWFRSVTFSPWGPWINGSYWTLPIEVAFYLLVFLSLCVRSGFYLYPLLSVMGWVSASACLLLGRSPLVTPLKYTALLNTLAFPPGACTLLIYGAFFALGSYLYVSLMDRITVLRALTLVVCVTGCLAEVTLHARANAAATGTSANATLPLLLWGLTVCLLVVSVKTNASFHALLGRHGAMIVRRIAVATYPLYLLHADFGQAVIGFTHRRLGYGPALVLSTMLVSALAIGVAEVLEPPLRRMLKSLWRGGQTEGGSRS